MAVDGKVVANTGAKRRDAVAMPPAAVARAIAFAIEQPPGVDIGEVVVRLSAQA